MLATSAHIIAGATRRRGRPASPCAPAAAADGGTGQRIERELAARGRRVALHLTATAGGPRHLDTDADLAALVRSLVADPEARLLFMPVAPAPRGIAAVRRDRKDIFLVGFSTTAGASEAAQFAAGLALIKAASCNLVLATDRRTGVSMIVTPEQASYHVTRDLEAAISNLVEMALLRSELTFTRSRVVPGELVPWSSELVPAALRRVVDHCVARGAYRPFLGATAGHFAVKLGEGRLLMSRRGADFNRLSGMGLVLVEARGDDEVIAHGARPSAGGQSQRILFAEHPGLDCVVHFHCPLRPGSGVPLRSQRGYECGSRECGRNTSEGLGRFGDLRAVMLDRHGPNIVFSRGADPERIIHFIEHSFDLAASTAGYPLPADGASPAEIH